MVYLYFTPYFLFLMYFPTHICFPVLWYIFFIPPPLISFTSFTVRPLFTPVPLSLLLSPGVFELNDTTGVISTAKPLDYEANSSFVLKVEADSMRVASSNFRAPSKSKCMTLFVKLWDYTTCFFSYMGLHHFRLDSFSWTSPATTQAGSSYKYAIMQLHRWNIFGMIKGPVCQIYNYILWQREYNTHSCVYWSV